MPPRQFPDRRDRRIRGWMNHAATLRAEFLHVSPKATNGYFLCGHGIADENSNSVPHAA